MPRSIPKMMMAALEVLALGSTGVATMLPARSAEAASDLIISQYVEGSSLNKAIEFFNGTDSMIGGERALLDQVRLDVLFFQ